MEDLNALGWLVIRLAVGIVYLFALYMNVRNSAARAWLLEHTEYMVPKSMKRFGKQLTLLIAVGGMALMFFGSVSILLGLEGRIGGLLLFIFTAFGILQHKRERQVAQGLASSVEPQECTEKLNALMWSAYSGHFSSGLKNWALCGVSLFFILCGTGPWSILDSWRK